MIVNTVSPLIDLDLLLFTRIDLPLTYFKFSRVGSSYADAPGGQTRHTNDRDKLPAAFLPISLPNRTFAA